MHNILMIARVLTNLIRVGFLYVKYSSLLLFLSGETYLRGQNTIQIRKLLFYYKASFLFLSCEHNFYVYTKDYSILFSNY